MQVQSLTSVILSLLLSSIAVFVTGKILPGVHIDSFGTALVTAIVLGFINTFIRPIIIILTLPINILTLGLFTLVIIALMVMLASAIVPGFRIDGFWWALAFGIVLWVVNTFIHSLTRL